MLDSLPKKYLVLTYGCQMNEHDSGVMERLLSEAGMVEADTPEKADVVLVNTCCVRERAEARQKGRIASLKRLKTGNPDVIIGICGCIAQKDRERLFEELPHLDLVLGPHAIPELPPLLERIWRGDRMVAGDFSDRGMVVTGTRFDPMGITAFVTVMKGCDNYCSYCIVPYVRGRPASRHPDDILQEIGQLAARGVKEVTLLGQNVNAYGLDRKNSCTFLDLLNHIDSSGLVERIRFVTSHPKDFTRGLVETVAAGTHLCECFHLPAQAGSDRVLAAMHRGYTRNEYIAKADWIRSLIPGASITTDLIVAFPGETEAEFEETVALVERVRFDRSHTFFYSPRAGTVAAGMAGLLPLETRKERLRRLVAVTNRITAEQSSARAGTVQEVLVEGPSKKDPARLMGRTRSDSIVVFESRRDLTGRLVNVRIDRARPWTLFGTMTDPEIAAEDR